MTASYRMNSYRKVFLYEAISFTPMQDVVMVEFKDVENIETQIQPPISTYKF